MSNNPSDPASRRKCNGDRHSVAEFQDAARLDRHVLTGRQLLALVTARTNQHRAIGGVQVGGHHLPTLGRHLNMSAADVVSRTLEGHEPRRLEVERSGSGARPTRTARSTSAVVPSLARRTQSTGRRTKRGPCGGIAAPHIRQLLAAGGLPCPDGQSAANIKDSVEEPSGGGMLGTGG